MRARPERCKSGIAQVRPSLPALEKRHSKNPENRLDFVCCADKLMRMRSERPSKSRMFRAPGLLAAPIWKMFPRVLMNRQITRTTGWDWLRTQPPRQVTPGDSAIPKPEASFSAQWEREANGLALPRTAQTQHSTRASLEAGKVLRVVRRQLPVRLRKAQAGSVAHSRFPFCCSYH